MSPNEKGTVYIGSQFLFRSRDHGQSWDRISSDLTTNDPEKQKQEESGGVTVDNSDAETHTTIYSISESPRDANLIWVGTDDGNLQLPRDSDLVVATHGRGIWIIDDISPLRKLTPEVMAQEAGFIQGRVTQQRLNSNGGWAEGSAMFTGSNPPDAAVITYYQKKRHIFGKMKIEVLDPQGKVVDTLPANSRRGISRVEWPMRLKPPQVPPAATAAFEAAFGPRVLPGNYTVKMTRGKETYTTPLVVQLDARAKFSAEDRKQDFDAVMRVYDLLGDMSFDVVRINSVRDALADRAAKLK